MRARRLMRTVLTTLGVLAGGVLFAAAPALAAPEVPVTEAAGAVTGTSAVLHGELNPLAVSKAGWYFAYSTGATCTGASTTTPGAEEKVLAQPEQTEVSGLEPSRKYTFCLVASDEAGESTPGNEVPFETLAVAPEVIEGSEHTSGVTTSEARLEGAVNPENQVTSCEFRYGTEETLAGSTSVPCEPASLEGFGGQGVAVSVSGLRLGTPYYYRVIAENAAHEKTEGPIEHFTTSPAAPLVSTGAVSEIGQSSANVTGTVTPEGLETYYYYQYGPTTEYGQSTAPGEPGIDVGAGTSPVQAPATLVPLVPGVTYHYRIVARNEGFASYGQDETFTAATGQAPTVSTGAASGVSVDEATISGTINPEGKETSYRFEYGEGTEYGTQTFGTVLPEQGVQTVTVNLRGIDPNTTYHYRLVVSNPGGTVYGEDMSFTTLPIAFPVIAPTPPPLIALPSFTFPTGNEVGTTNTGKTKKHAKKTHGKKKHKKAKQKKKAGGKGKKK